VTTLEGLRASLDAIAARPNDPTWIFLAPHAEIAARAAALDALSPAERATRPLVGAPFAVKDNIDVAGWPTTAGCPAFAYVPARSATVVERLERAGAVLLGKTNMDQFATGLVGTRSPYGIPENPFDARWIPGGSSSGSAVAVARGLVAFALGTDTAGSGRVPAACTGTVGLKPTHGLISTAGVVPACASLDCVSIFAATVGDAELVLDVAAGADPRDPFSRTRAAVHPPSRGAARQLAVPRSADLRFFGDDEAQRSFERTLAMLSATFSITEVDFHPFAEAAALLYDGPFVAERTAAVGAFIAAHPDDVLPVTRSIVESGWNYSAVDAFRAQYRLRALRREIAPHFERSAALLVPTIPTMYRIDEVLAEPYVLNANLGTYTNFVNLLDLCAVAFPSDRYADGRSIGITLIGPAFAEAPLSALAQAASSLLMSGAIASSSRRL
jgi:allophanate hydrolase